MNRQKNMMLLAMSLCLHRRSTIHMDWNMLE